MNKIFNQIQVNIKFLAGIEDGLAYLRKPAWLSRDEI